MTDRERPVFSANDTYYRETPEEVRERLEKKINEILERERQAATSAKDRSTVGMLNKVTSAINDAFQSYAKFGGRRKTRKSRK